MVDANNGGKKKLKIKLKDFLLPFLFIDLLSKFAFNSGNAHNLDLSIGGIFNYHLRNSSQNLNIQTPKVPLYIYIW